MAHKVFPNIALCDGKYLISAPKRIIANTAVDALGHMIESYIKSETRWNVFSSESNVLERFVLAMISWTLFFCL